MKKDRNSFFESSAMNMTAYNNTMPYMMPQVNTMANGSFYANAPVMGMMTPMMKETPYNNDESINELESRMAKLERNINRLENRISKLEGTTYYSNDNLNNPENGMYMV